MARWCPAWPISCVVSSRTQLTRAFSAACSTSTHEIDELLRDPADAAKSGTSQVPAEKEGPDETVNVPPFKNQPASDFARRDERESFPRAIAVVRNNLGKTYPLYINGKEIITTDILPSVNPARPDEVIGHVCQAGKEEADQAIRAAQSAFLAWRDVEPQGEGRVSVKGSSLTSQSQT